MFSLSVTHAQSNWSMVNGLVLSGGCYQLTKNKTHQKAAIWNQEMIDLDKPFKLYFNFNFGNSNNGADGIAVIFQKSAAGLGAIGEDGANMGYASSGTAVVSPSLDIEFDTYDDGAWLYNDIADDHLQINLHASTNYVVDWPTPLKGTGVNVEDNVYHSVQLIWDPANIYLDIYFDCVLIKHFYFDIKNWAFDGDNMVYYGITSATGSQDNSQTFCELFHKAGDDITFCPGDPVTLQGSSNFTTYSWSPSIGLSCTNCLNPVANPTTNTEYVFTGTIGCLTLTDTVKLSTFCDPLPIELVSFNAVCLKEQVRMNWVTASELNNDYFTLERSYDGSNFEAIGIVDGAGNSTGTRNYNFVDQHPFSGLSYYRLKQTDFDGTSTYSKIQQVSCSSPLSVVIYPNPAAEITTLQIQSEENVSAVCTIVSVAGEIVYKNEIELNKGILNLNINTLSFPSGIYDVSVISKNRLVHSLLLVP